ncbi:aromatic ring-hydroxylating dioxygenase subunit alpha [Bdellovibrio bacteriovorus]|uniref:aromatic ring-hydroxylating oxygenase subunit alpha n=1 Tax=Bdellovibrio TaxID=958 RepID=UPI0035A91D3A
MRTFGQILSDTLSHMENGSLEVGPQASSLSVKEYLDADRYQSEIQEVLKKHPMPLVNSDRLKMKETFYAGEICGVPVIAVRDEQGKARVFLNACRHRGAPLNIKNDGGQRFVCPFHGWSYSLEGEILDIPVSDQCFTHLSSKAFRLKEIKSYECAGLVWILLDPEGEVANLEAPFEQLHHDQEELGFLPAHPVKEISFTVNFNWKIGVEAFLEVYHFTHAHAPYLAQLQFPNLSLADQKGKNARIVVPLRKPTNQEPPLKWAQVMYYIFPSSFLLFYDDHAALISLLPAELGKTQFRYVPLVPTLDGANDAKIRQKVEFLEVIIGQDIEILEGVQKGLTSQANRQFTFTRLESLLSQFHRDLKDCYSVP